MAIDTDNGQLAVLSLGVLFMPNLPISPGALGQDDQQQLLWGFPEILWEEPEAQVETPGGVFRATESGRVFRATESGRVFRCSQDGNLPVTQLILISGEQRAYCWEFGPRREMEAGETIASPSIPAVSGVSIGSPAVLAAAFDGVPIGKGVKATVTSSTPGTYTIICSVTTSGGATIKERGTLIVI